ncbi:chemotaxis-specific protein-glutamate methyltransferase CheB [Qipengyuania nanhaisediminis]|uniref:chemotaxis-specific protein-glutamate methyltransferase CheB n=1 Tax=Qipengyuania nanhaisediminis TaxID=604088 RepID=UPI0038B2DEAB
MNAPTSSPGRMMDGAHPVRPADTIRVMLIDDSLTVRTIFKRMIESDPAMKVIETAGSAERGIAKLAGADLDVILLDLEMPGMGGLEALPSILKAAPEAQVMVVSSLTEDGAEATVTALSRGAADTMLKPRPGAFNDDYRAQLLGKIRALGAGRQEDAQGEASEAGAPATPARHRRSKRPEVLAIGASTGGIHALNLMLRTLTDQFTLPILITQHLPSSFIPVFARQIEVASGRTTHIAEDGTEIRAGEIGIATGHGHMLVRRSADGFVTGLCSRPVENGCLPSVDPMLSSLAETCDGRAIALILSGMGRDGLAGARQLVAAGGTLWAQDCETSAVWGMPGAVHKAGLTSFVASPEKLGQALMDELVSASDRDGPQGAA